MGKVQGSTRVEVVRTSERVTLVNESDLERYMATTRLVADAAVRSLHALREAQRVQAIIRERYGLHQAGWAAEAVRQVREVRCLNGSASTPASSSP